METHIAVYHEWLKREDKSHQTIRAYITSLNSFYKWLMVSDNVGEWYEVTSLHLMDYRSYLMNNLEHKPTSVNRSISALKTYFAWAQETKLITSNPAQKIKMKRVQQNFAPKWLNHNEKNRLIYTIQAEKNNMKQARDHAIVLTMLLAGLRVEEVSDLKANHVDIKQNLITILDGKGGKYRVVPLHQDLKKAIKEWLTFRVTSDKKAHRESPYMFVSERAGQVTTRGIAYMVDHYMEMCGLIERDGKGVKLTGQASCHSLRHTFCKSLLDAGVPIQNIAKLAGHDNIQTTQRYVEASEEDLKNAISKLI